MEIDWFAVKVDYTCYDFLSFLIEIFLMQIPLYVATKMASIRKSSFFVPSTDGYAKAGVKWIGYEPRCTHTLLWAVACSLPEFVVDAWRLWFCLGIRKRGQRKDSMKKE